MSTLIRLPTLATLAVCLLFARPAVAPAQPQPGPLTDPAASATTMSPVSGTSPVDAAGERVRLVNRLVADLPFPARLGSLQRYVDPSRWLFGVRNGLQPASGNTARRSRYRFCCFITPEADPADAPRERPFSLEETLRRAWRHSTFTCKGELPGDRLVFEASRSTGREPESWFVVFWFARNAAGRWAITRIDDAKTLRFCLVEDNAPPRENSDGDRQSAGPQWLLLTPFAAREACRAGIAPSGAARLERETFGPMGLSDPLMPPYLLIETIDLERGRLRVGSRYGDGIAIGEPFVCYGQRPYRLVGLADHQAVIENWAGYRFVLDKRTQTLDPPDPDFIRLGGDKPGENKSPDDD